MKFAIYRKHFTILGNLCDRFANNAQTPTTAVFGFVLARDIARAIVSSLGDLAWVSEGGCTNKVVKENVFMVFDREFSQVSHLISLYALHAMLEGDEESRAMFKTLSEFNHRKEVP